MATFRPVDGEPSLTLNFAKFLPDQRFHGLRKIHLNNGKEDPTFLCEAISAEMFARAGLPAARVTHAHARLNGRDLGSYVVIEGFTHEFLARYFKNTHGDLYDSGFCHDITHPLERIAGKGPDNWQDLKQLVTAAQIPEPDRRWRELGVCLDTNSFGRYLAMQVLTVNWDGYALYKNNYRIYHDPDSDRLHFIPHGMDQMFSQPRSPLIPQRWEGLVASAFMETSEGRALYAQQLRLLFAEVYQTESLVRRVDELADRVRPMLAGRSAETAMLYDRVVAGLRGRIEQRGKYLARQLAAPESMTLPRANRPKSETCRGYSGRSVNDRVVRLQTQASATASVAQCGIAAQFVSAYYRRMHHIHRNPRRIFFSLATLATLAGLAIHDATAIDTYTEINGSDGDGESTVGPEYTTDKDLTDLGARKGKYFEFTMKLADSKIFRGDDKTLEPDKKTIRTERKISVYVPAAYRDGSAAPFLIIHDGPGLMKLVRNALDNLTIAKDVKRKLPAFIAIAVENGGNDGKNSERGLEYDTLSDRLARFINDEVLPAVMANTDIKAAYPRIAFTKNPWGHAVMGCSSGGAAALTMGWFRPDLFRRIIAYSGTFVDQQDDDAAEEAQYPLGAWEYHSGMKLIEKSEKRPLRIFTHVSENDLRNKDAEDTHHNWVMAGQRTSAALTARGYHHRFVFSKATGHCDGKVFNQTLSDTLLWIWRGYHGE